MRYKLFAVYGSLVALAACTSYAILRLTPESPEALPLTQCRSHEPYPDLTDCSKFYSCSSNGPELFQCPLGFHFNPTKLACDWANDAECVHNDDATITMLSVETTYADEKATGFQEVTVAGVHNGVIISSSVDTKSTLFTDNILLNIISNVEETTHSNNTDTKTNKSQFPSVSPEVTSTVITETYVNPISTTVSNFPVNDYTKEMDRNGSSEFNNFISTNSEGRNSTIIFGDIKTSTTFFDESQFSSENSELEQHFYVKNSSKDGNVTIYLGNKDGIIPTEGNIKSDIVAEYKPNQRVTDKIFSVTFIETKNDTGHSYIDESNHIHNNNIPSTVKPLDDNIGRSSSENPLNDLHSIDSKSQSATATYYTDIGGKIFSNYHGDVEIPNLDPNNINNVDIKPVVDQVVEISSNINDSSYVSDKKKLQTFVTENVINNITYVRDVNFTFFPVTSAANMYVNISALNKEELTSEYLKKNNSYASNTYSEIETQYNRTEFVDGINFADIDDNDVSRANSTIILLNEQEEPYKSTTIKYKPITDNSVSTESGKKDDGIDNTLDKRWKNDTLVHIIQTNSGTTNLQNNAEDRNTFLEIDYNKKEATTVSNRKIAEDTTNKIMDRYQTNNQKTDNGIFFYVNLTKPVQSTQQIFNASIINIPKAIRNNSNFSNAALEMEKTEDNFNNRPNLENPEVINQFLDENNLNIVEAMSTIKPKEINRVSTDIKSERNFSSTYQKNFSEPLSLLPDLDYDNLDYKVESTEDTSFDIDELVEEVIDAHLDNINHEEISKGEIITNDSRPVDSEIFLTISTIQEDNRAYDKSVNPSYEHIGNFELYTEEGSKHSESKLISSESSSKKGSNIYNNYPYVEKDEIQLSTESILLTNNIYFNDNVKVNNSTYLKNEEVILSMLNTSKTGDREFSQNTIDTNSTMSMLKNNDPVEKNDEKFTNAQLPIDLNVQTDTTGVMVSPSESESENLVNYIFIDYEKEEKQYPEIEGNDNIIYNYINNNNSSLEPIKNPISDTSLDMNEISNTIEESDTPYKNNEISDIGTSETYIIDNVTFATENSTRKNNADRQVTLKSDIFIKNKTSPTRYSKLNEFSLLDDMDSKNINSDKIHLGDVTNVNLSSSEDPDMINGNVTGDLNYIMSDNMSITMFLSRNDTIISKHTQTFISKGSKSNNDSVANSSNDLSTDVAQRVTNKNESETYLETATNVTLSIKQIINMTVNNNHLSQITQNAVASPLQNINIETIYTNLFERFTKNNTIIHSYQNITAKSNMTSQNISFNDKYNDTINHIEQIESFNKETEQSNTSIRNISKYIELNSSIQHQEYLNFIKYVNSYTEDQVNSMKVKLMQMISNLSNYSTMMNNKITDDVGDKKEKNTDASGSTAYKDKTKEEHTTEDNFNEDTNKNIAVKENNGYTAIIEKNDNHNKNSTVEVFRDKHKLTDANKDDKMDVDETNQQNNKNNRIKNKSHRNGRQKHNTKENSTDEDSTDEDSTDEDSTDEDSTKEDSRDEDSTGEDSTEEDSTGEDSTEEDCTDEDSTEEYSTDEDSTDEHSTEEEETKKRKRRYRTNGENRTADDIENNQLREENTSEGDSDSYVAELSAIEKLINKTKAELNEEKYHIRHLLQAENSTASNYNDHYTRPLNNRYNRDKKSNSEMSTNGKQFLEKKIGRRNPQRKSKEDIQKTEENSRSRNKNKSNNENRTWRTIGNKKQNKVGNRNNKGKHAFVLNIKKVIFEKSLKDINWEL